MLFDNGINTVKKRNMIVAQYGNRIYELTVNPVEDHSLDEIGRQASIQVHSYNNEDSKDIELAVFAFGDTVHEYYIEDIIYKVMQTVDGIGVLYAIDEESTLGKRCTLRMREEEATMTVVFSIRKSI